MKEKIKGAVAIGIIGIGLVYYYAIMIPVWGITWTLDKVCSLGENF